MRRGELKVEWRGKVNPLFVLAIQWLRFMVRIAKEFHQKASDIESHAPTILAQVCQETIPLLPAASSEDPGTKQELRSRLENMQEDDPFLNEPEVREALVEIASRIQATPKALLMRGLEAPHWWMIRNQLPWAVRLKESFLNALAILHFKMTLDELKERVIHGDPDLFAALLNIDKELLFSPVTTRLMENFREVAEDPIIIRLLALRGDPPGHQLGLRMVLFFGWDFGLKDLSNDQLYTFLVEMQIIPAGYDPETLRKYRNRLRQLIRRVSPSSPT